MARVLSEDLKKRMRKALERKRLGYTHHLEIAGRMVEKKIEALFKEWGLDVNDVLFRVISMTWQEEMIFDLAPTEVKFKDVVQEILKQVKLKETRIVLVECSDKGVLRKTEETGNVIFLEKIKLEFLVEGYKEWNSRLGDRGQAKVETQ